MPNNLDKWLPGGGEQVGTAQQGVGKGPPGQPGGKKSGGKSGGSFLGGGGSSTDSQDQGSGGGGNSNPPPATGFGLNRVAGVNADDSPEDDDFNMPMVDTNAYKNPVGDQSGNWQAAMGNYLGATTGTAPQLGYVNAGQAAQLGPTATYGGAQMDRGQYNQTWNSQWALANQLGQMAKGEGPSMAQVQAKQMAEQSLQNQMAMLGAQRGASNPAMAAYQAQQMGAQSMQQAAQQAVAGRTQEQMAALQARGQLLGSMNQQAQQFSGNQAQLQQQAQLASMGAINQQNAAQAQLNQQMQQYQAGLYQDVNQSNLQAQMAQQSLNAQQYNNYLSLLQQQTMADYQAQMAEQAQLSSNYLVAQGIQKDLAMNQAQTAAQWGGAVAGLASGLIGAGAGIASSASDIRVKKKVQLGEKELNKVLEDVYQNPSNLKLLMIL